MSTPTARYWGDEKTLQFVTLYKSYECLWNPRSLLYKNNVARINAYKSLINDLNDPTLTIKIIKTKIKNLRTSYHNELKKIYASKRSRAEGDDVYLYQPPMSWFAEMASLMGDAGVPTPSDYGVTAGSGVESDTSSQHSMSANNDMSIIVSSLTSPVEYSRRRKKIKVEHEESDGVPETLSRSDVLSHAEMAIRNNEDEFHYFGLNVASQLRQLPIYEALGVQTEIQAMLAEARRRHIESQQ